MTQTLWRILSALALALLAVLILRSVLSPEPEGPVAQVDGRTAGEEAATRMAPASTDPRSSARSGGPVPPEAMVRLSVVDCVGRPVASARVVAGASGMALAETDAEGSAGFEIQAPTDAKVVHPAFGMVAVSLLPGSEMDLVLGLEGSILGELRCDEGIPMPSGAAICFWRAEGSLPSDPDVLARHLVPVDDSGRFRICGLDPGARYELAAGAPGWACRSILQGAVAGDQKPQVLSLARVFGAVVRGVSREGAPLRGSPSLASLSYGWDVDVPGGALLPPGSIQSRLCGLPEERLIPRAGEALLLLFGPGDASSLGPYRCTAEVPGYEVGRCTWTATPVEYGLDVQDLVLSPVANGWGSVAVRLSGRMPASDGRPGTSLPEVRLVLQPVDGNAVQGLAYRMDDVAGLLEGARFVVDDVPVGRYAATIEAWHKALRVPAPRDPARIIDVRAEERSELALDLGAVAQIEVSITEQDGEPYLGPARVFLGVETEPPLPEEVLEGQAGAVSLMGGTTGFARPPYRLRFVSPGDYVLELSHPRPGSPERVHVRVDPGATSRVTFSR